MVTINVAKQQRDRKGNGRDRNSGTSNGRVSYVGNGRDRNGESRRYPRNRNGLGC
jgi:hypothetical protein